MENNELSHHGTKGMRWGVRRYQNKDGSLTAAGKKRYGNSHSDADGAEESLEQRKTRILNSHSAKEIYKNKDLFTDKEILDAYLRLNNERNIKNLIPEEVSRGRKFVDGYVSVSKTVKSLVDSSDDLYKSYEKAKKLIDTFVGADKAKRGNG